MTSTPLPTPPSNLIVSVMGSAPVSNGALQWLVPAGLSVIVALIVLGVNSWLTTKFHKERLAGDRSLAEWKAKADLDLAAHKIALDRDFAAWKRKAELAEEALALFYELRAAVDWSRSRAIFPREGLTRPDRDENDDKLKTKRDQYYTPIERLNAVAPQIARLQALQLRFAAMFGEGSANPFDAISAAIREIRIRAFTLIEGAAFEELRPPEETIAARQAIWGVDRPDMIDKNINDAIDQMNAICGPILRTTTTDRSD